MHTPSIRRRNAAGTVFVDNGQNFRVDRGIAYVSRNATEEVFNLARSLDSIHAVIYGGEAHIQPSAPRQVVDAAKAEADEIYQHPSIRVARATPSTRHVDAE